MFESTVLRRKCRPAREEVTRRWRELHYLHSSAVVFGAGCMKDRIYVKLINILVTQRKGKSRLGRNRCRWENNNKKCLRELGCEGEDWIYLAQDLPVVDTL